MPFANLVRPAFDVHALFARTSVHGRPTPSATVVFWWATWLVHHAVALVLPVTSPQPFAGPSAFALQASLTAAYAASTVYVVRDLSSRTRALADHARVRQATTSFG